MPFASPKSSGKVKTVYGPSHRLPRLRASVSSVSLIGRRISPACSFPYVHPEMSWQTAPTVLTGLTLVARVPLREIVRVPARPSRLKHISISTREGASAPDVAAPRAARIFWPAGARAVATTTIIRRAQKFRGPSHPPAAFRHEVGHANCHRIICDDVFDGRRASGPRRWVTLRRPTGEVGHPRQARETRQSSVSERRRCPPIGAKVRNAPTFYGRTDKAPGYHSPIGG